MHYEYISKNIMKNCTNAWAQRIHKNDAERKWVLDTFKNNSWAQNKQTKKREKRCSGERAICSRCKMTFSLLHELHAESEHHLMYVSYAKNHTPVMQLCGSIIIMFGDNDNSKKKLSAVAYVSWKKPISFAITRILRKSLRLLVYFIFLFFVPFRKRM